VFCFLLILLARYVPNVAKADLRFCKSLPGRISNGHISATNRPIHFRFGSSVGLLGSANLTVLFIFTPTGPCCHGNRILDKMSYNLVSVRDISKIFAFRPIGGFSKLSRRTVPTKS